MVAQRVDPRWGVEARILCRSLSPVLVDTVLQLDDGEVSNFRGNRMVQEYILDGVSIKG